MTWRHKLHANMATVTLMIATFFNPLGFDALFALIMKKTGSYWITDVIFYCLSAFFFGLYFFYFKPILKKHESK
jgi:H+/Cl- antiporter ClcA